MPIFPAPRIQALLEEAFANAGTPRDIAGYVASSLVDSSLKGVDSHGVMRVVKYINEIESGWIHPDARPDVIQETGTMAVVRGNRGFGIHALGYAVDLAIEKVLANQVAAVGLVDTTHTGRLGWYGEKAAENNTMLIIAGGGHSGTATSGRWVAPYGGAERVLSTNPYVFGLPGGKFGSMVVDFATSAVGEGKLQIYRGEHKPLEPGWIQDREGHPSTNVEDFYAGGALLPMAGHKGYGLSVFAELLGSALLGTAHTMNWMVLALNISAFTPVTEYQQRAESFLQKLKVIHPAEGFKEVMFPGEPEAKSAKQRSIQGIVIPDETWESMKQAIQKVGVHTESMVSQEEKS